MRNAYLTFALTGHNIADTLEILLSNWPNIPDMRGIVTPEEDRELAVN